MRCLDLVVTAFLVTIVGLSIRLFNVSVFFKMATKDILDIAQQTYIVAAVVMPFILSILSLPANKELGPFLPRFETVQGIGGIKELLYADFSLFLIFSTVVLLVALFGAAIMTRKHYQNNSLNDQ